MFFMKKGLSFVLFFIFLFFYFVFIKVLSAPLPISDLNPNLPASCGIDIALVIDVSGSINSGEYSQMVTAFNGFVDAFLPGTPAKISVTQFSDTAFVVQEFTDDKNVIKSAISSRVFSGMTNWVDGLLKAHSTFQTNPRPAEPDLVIFASDGNPNRPSGGKHIENSIIAANNMKKDGIRILALGIGGDLKKNNLVFISGSNIDTGGLDTDVITTNFEDLAKDLADYARILCGNKMLVRVNIDEDGDGNYELDGTFQDIKLKDWNFAGAGKTSLTDNWGKAEISVDSAGTYSLTETKKFGYKIDNAECFKDSNSIGNFDSVTDTMNKLQFQDQETVSCVFYNSKISVGSKISAQIKIDSTGDGNYDLDGSFSDSQLKDWNVKSDGINSLTDNLGYTEISVSAGVDSLNELVKSGYNLNDIYCFRNLNPVPIGHFDSATNTINNLQILDGDNISCVLYNSKIFVGSKISAQIKIDSTGDGNYDLDGSFSDSQLKDWNVKSDGINSLTDNLGYTEISVSAGVDSLNELVKSGYNLNDIYCFRNLNPVPIGHFDSATNTINNLQILDGDNISCVLYNSKIFVGSKISAQIKIDSTGDGNYDLDGSFSDSQLKDWNVKSGGIALLTDNQGYLKININAGTYSLIEIIKSGYTLDNITCFMDSNLIGHFDKVGKKVDNLILLDGKTVYCDFLNTKKGGGRCNKYRTQLQCENFNVDLAKESVKFWRDDGKTCPDIIGNLAGCDFFLEDCACIWDIQLNKCRTKVNVSMKSCSAVSLPDVGMCIYESEKVINCSQGPFFEAMMGDWFWSPVNQVKDCNSQIGRGCFNELGNSYFDPFSDYKICLNPKVVPCSTELAFFGFFQFSLVILLISIIYFFLILKKR